MTADLAGIDREIANLEKRRVDLDHQVKPSFYAPFDGDAMAAAAAVDKQLAALRQRRVRALAGVEEPAPPRAAPSLPPLPGRMTKRTDKENDTPAPEPDGPHAAAIAELVAEARQEIPDFFELIENKVEEYCRLYPRENYAITITFANYHALLGELVHLHSSIRLEAKIARYHRKRLEKNAGSSDELATLRTQVAQLERKMRPDAGDLERRIADLEARPSFQYRGVYSSAVHYKNGDFVTYQGALWHCSDAAFGTQPGDGLHWKMAVKSGRDGRDTR